ncbi:MAG: hypothetical protein IJW16_05640 [Clostridia bacterium]|nr:hypothetical protein [Clostridia bacterium]
MTEKNMISLELKHHRVANNRNYYEDLSIPANDAEITDVKQRLRCLYGEEPEVAVLGCSLIPELREIRPVGTLLEYNAFAKRLEAIPDDEANAFRALVTKALAENKYEIPVKDLINMTYGLDRITVASNVFTDEMLGAFVIENGMNDMINELSDDVVKLLDRSAVGMIQRKADSGFYCSRNYYVLADYEAPVVYDGVKLPQELMPDHVTFRIDENGGIHSPIPYLKRLPVRADDDAETLRKMENIWNNMNAGQQVAFKAILESEQPTALEDCRYLSGCLRKFEFSYFSDENDTFAKEYLLYHLPENFQSEALQRATLYDFGTELLDRLGATVTPYGVISESDGFLFSKYTDATGENNHTTKYDVVEVMGQKALYTNWRLLSGEIPDGCYCYDIRSDDGSPFATLEPKVFVDYGGSVLVKQPIDLVRMDTSPLPRKQALTFLGRT